MADAYGHMSMRSGDHPASYGEGILKMVDILKKSAQGCPDGIRMIVAEMTEDIEAAESQEEIKEIFCRTARRLTEENSDMDEKREKTAVEWIRDYIDRHYSGSADRYVRDGTSERQLFQRYLPQRDRKVF